MKYQPTGLLESNMRSLAIIVFLTMFLFPVSASVIHAVAPKPSWIMPWNKILNWGISPLHPSLVPGHNPAGNAIAAKWSLVPLPGVSPPYLRTKNKPAAVTKNFVTSLEPLSSWRATAAMAHGRTGHSATLLPDGRVLVAGGWEEFDTLLLASAEIYNPADNTWTSAGAMTIARGLHTATLLPNGKVLITGGVDWQDSIYASTELYDPTTNSWRSAGNMNTARCGHTATLLADGRTLVAGGYYDISSPESTNSVDLYDPATNTWYTADSMTERRAQHSTTLLPDGRVLAAGGFNNSAGALSSAEIYDPAEDTWSNAAAMNFGSYAHTGTVLHDGRVIVAGGTVSGNTLGRVEIYDPTANTWGNAADMSANRKNHSATLLPDSRVLVTGGHYFFMGPTGTLAGTEVYDPATDTWSGTGDLLTPREGHTATLLSDGRVFVAGGGNDFSFNFSTTETFSPADDTWSSTDEMAYGRSMHTATLLSNGRVLVAGGFINAEYSYAEVYDPVAKTWAPAGNLTNYRYWHTSTLLPDGRVLVVGGECLPDIECMNSTEFYDPIENTWNVGPSLLIARSSHTASLLPNGKVLITGGIRYSGNSLASAELYDPVTNTWGSVASMATARTLHTATLLQDGRVLVAGGYNNNTYLSSAELYDPSSNSWTDAGQMTTARIDFSASLLPDGRVLVAGGYDNDFTVLNNVELYDPATNSWSPAASMNEARYTHTGTQLADGRIIVTSGWKDAGDSRTGREIFDLASNTWTYADNLISAAGSSSATLLPDGQLLIAGGFAASTHLTNAELYDVGLSYDDAWRPFVTAVPEPLYLYLPFSLTGTGFRGDGNAEAASGGTNSSATNVPLIQLRSNLNGQVQWLKPTSFTADSYTGKPISDFPPGPAWLTVYVNGIPSVAEYVLVALPYSVTATVGENGRIEASTPSPAGVVPGSNDTVQFTFTADAHYHIAAITGCGIDYTNSDNGVASLTVTTAPITGDCTVNALFAIDRYTVSAQAGANGSLDDTTPSPQTIDYGATTQFTFQAAAGHHITSISGCGISYLNSDQDVSGRTETTGAITGDCTVSAVFTVNNYTLHVDITGKGKGTVSSNPAGLFCPEDCNEVFEYEKVVTLTAVPVRGSSFLRWTGECAGRETTCSVFMNNARNVQAEFHAFPWPMFLPAMTRSPLAGP